MIRYMYVVGVVSHIIVGIALVVFSTTKLYDLEVSRHEYHLASIYSNRSDPVLKQAVTDAMSDGKISWREWFKIERVEKETEDRDYMAKLLKNTGH